MEERLIRRFGRGQIHRLLPLHTSSQVQNPAHLANTLSCWYCDYKISAFNSPIYHLGRRFASFFKLWFSIGIGFTLTSLVLVTLVLVWDLGNVLHIFGDGNSELSDIVNSFLFGFSPRVYGLRVSISDAAYLLFSTVVSVSVHEFGHAISAASEGIQMEYVAVFVALLFPGALVAFNYELLQMLERFAALRIYCAGIWHNAVCCGACGLLLFLLPLILSPFYIYGESLMVLKVPSTSPLSGYLSPGDVIVSLDGKHVHYQKEWMEMAAVLHEQALQNSNLSESSKSLPIVYGRKGYCVPTSLIEESKKIHLLDDESACPNDLTEFVAIQCSDSSNSHDIFENGHGNRKDGPYCLNAKNVVKLNKCGRGSGTELIDRDSCSCSEDELCLSPVQFPGLIWTEITYSKPYSPGCSLLGRKSLPDSEIEMTVDSCAGAFVFVGDVISMAHSVQLTSYQPRWAFTLCASIPKVMEKSLICTFHVSLTVALLNSLPVYFLDGESILEAALCHLTFLGPRTRKKVMQVCLLGGTAICTLAFVRLFFINVF